jgi:uncharacterized membrane protein YfcA
VAVLTQNLGAVWSFQRYRVLEWHRAADMVLPALVGSAFGTWAALRVGDRGFQRILAVLMLAVTLWTLIARPGSEGIRDARTRGAGGAGEPRLSRTALHVAFFGVGLYGGFVQAGIGFLILAVTTQAGLDLVRGNALKVLVVLLLTALSLAIFAGAGKVEWVPGLVLGAGSLLGAFVGARLTVKKGHHWIRGVVTVTIVAFAIALWFQ